MKKIGLLIIFVLLFSSLALSQVNKTNQLEVRFHSVGKQAVIDLTEYLGEADEFFHSKSENIIIQIDPETSIATLFAVPGWDGVETITFSKTKLISTKEIKQELETDIGNQISNIPIKNAVEQITQNIQKESIISLDSSLIKNQIYVNLNDEAKIVYTVEEIPEIKISLTTPSVSSPEATIFDIERLILYISIIVMVAIVLIYWKNIFIFLFTRELSINLKNKFLTQLIDIQRIKNKEEKNEELLKLLTRFFSTLRIKQNSTRLKLIKILDKRKIKGDLKQQIIYLFSKYTNYKYSKKDDIIKHFRRILGLL